MNTIPGRDGDQIPRYDLLVVGGGINGAGIARDAAGRGLKVLLVEKDDLAAHTSSASTKLIHGGLRYLEYHEFRLVRESLMERERLLAIAPHIISPLRFVMPQPKTGRSGWMIRIGLFLYDHIGGRRTLPGSGGVSLRGPWGVGLKPELTKGFVYSDCRVQDSRLVVLNAMDAAERGAGIAIGTGLVGARWERERWSATLKGQGGIYEVSVRAIVNAAGPWVHSVLASATGAHDDRAPRLVKGSHIVVRRLFEGDHAYILQNPDKRVVFAIPYERDFTLIGTTDIPWEGEPDAPKISEEEIRYLCESVSGYFAKPVMPADIVHTYSGVRALYDDGAENASAVTRDYVLRLGTDAAPQLLSVFGGKITTYRRLAEHVLEKLQPFLPPMGGPWTGGAPLPGGDIPDGDFAAFLTETRRRWPFLDQDLVLRLARSYGTRMEAIIGDATSLGKLGPLFGGDLYQAEVDYLVAREWARSAEDILWRRSRLGLHVGTETRAMLDDYLTAKAA